MARGSRRVAWRLAAALPLLLLVAVVVAAADGGRAFAADLPLKQAGELSILDARVAPSLKGTRNGAAYLTIRNAGGQPDRLLKAESPAARLVELHTHVKDGDIMRMRPVPAIELPAGQSIAMAPGGLHVMFVEVVRPFAVGDKVPLTLTFERAGRLDLELPVAPSKAAGGAHKGH